MVEADFRKLVDLVRTIEKEAARGLYSGRRNVAGATLRSNLRDCEVFDLLPESVRQALRDGCKQGAAIICARKLIEGQDEETVSAFVRWQWGSQPEPPPYRGRRVR